MPADPATTPVILSAVRTPVGRFQGGLAPLAAPALGALAIREAVRRSALPPEAVEDVIMGHVLQGGAGQAPARQAAVGAGLPPMLPALTVNMVCGSGLKAVMLAAQAVKAGDVECVVAGGMESMSNAPYYLTGLRSGVKFGHQRLVDALIHDGLWCSFGDTHMGRYAEYTARAAGIGRADQDAFALESHRRAVAAQDACLFKDEIVPVEVPARRATARIEADEGPRRDTSLKALAALQPAFEKDGTVTAGNSPGLNDAASALVIASAAFARAHGLPVMARITGYSAAGSEPRDLFFAPIAAVERLMRKAGTRIGDYHLIEINEAFAAQALADGKALGWDWQRVNVHGGAVALGHPIGASGARILTTMLYAMKSRGAATGLATLCLGGGNAVALSVEYVS